MVTLIVFCTWVALGNRLSHGVAGVLALALGIALGRHFWAPFIRTVRRMRWFFLSIIVLYVWFVPVEDVGLVGEFAEFTGYADGVVAGLERVMVLAVILIAVTSFIVTTDRSELLNAVMWLSRPAAYIGLSSETIAVRFTLLFGVLAQMQQIVENARPLSLIDTRNESRWERWSHAATTLFTETISRAMSTPLDPMVLPPMPPPALLEWGVPFVLFLIGFACTIG